MQTKAGVQMLFNDPAIAEKPISASIRGRSIKQGIQIILSGFSYALHSSAPGHTVVVLSTLLQRKGGADAIAALDTHDVPTAEAPAKGPQTLDEFRALAPLADEDTTDHSGDDDVALTDEAQPREAMLERALDVLKSPHRQLYAYAIDQLGMLNDQRAIDTLVKLAQQGPGRYLATEALARVAAQGQFEDPNAVTVLQRLASDQDDDVRRSASQALEQMRQVHLMVWGQ
ncbi:MAG: HEAT repeat domain-containing protein [Gammaproteobacteria bacterium]